MSIILGIIVFKQCCLITQSPHIIDKKNIQPNLKKISINISDSNFILSSLFLFTFNPILTLSKANINNSDNKIIMEGKKLTRIGKFIKQKRIEKGITQKELAEKIFALNITLEEYYNSYR